MMKLKKFEKLMTETEAKAEKVKEEDFNKIENVSATCDIVSEQINKLTTNLDMLKEKGELESLFIAMKRAEIQLKSLERNLYKLDTDTTVREYTFEPDEKLEAILKDQIAKRPSSVKDIPVEPNNELVFDIAGSLVLPNNQILIAGWNNKTVKIIDTNNNKTISELQLSGKPFGITKVTEHEVAVTVNGQTHKIQFCSVSNCTLSETKEISVNGECKAIEYSKKDHTLIVTYFNPSKIEILDMAGRVVKRLEKDANGGQIFTLSSGLALSPNLTEIYVSDYDRHTVTLISLNGNVKAVYKDNSLQLPQGLCVHKSGLVYVVGHKSHTVHQLNPLNGSFDILLKEKDGLFSPETISYCDLKDKIYIGMNSNLKVFRMK